MKAKMEFIQTEPRESNGNRKGKVAFASKWISAPILPCVDRRWRANSFYASEMEQGNNEKKILSSISLSGWKMVSAKHIPCPLIDLLMKGPVRSTADGKYSDYTSCDVSDTEAELWSFTLPYKTNVTGRRPKEYMGKTVNSRIMGCLSSSLFCDGRNSFFFLSNRKGGSGGNDIWFNISTERWGLGQEAKNLEMVNTIRRD